MKTLGRFFLWLLALSVVADGAWFFAAKTLHKNWSEVPWGLAAVNVVIIFLAAYLSRKKENRPWAEYWWGHSYRQQISRAGWEYRLNGHGPLL